MPTPNITFEDTGDYWKIRMNDLLHLQINKDEFLQFRAYNNGIKHKRYYIDIVYKSIVDTALYKTKELWEAMLKVLDQNIV